MLNVPVDLNEEELITEIPDSQKLKTLFDELEFKTVAARILSEIDKQEKLIQKNRKQKNLSKHPSGTVQGSLFSGRKNRRPFSYNRQLKTSIINISLFPEMHAEGNDFRMPLSRKRSVLIQKQPA